MGKTIHIVNECPFQISQFFGFCNMELYSSAGQGIIRIPY